MKPLRAVDIPTPPNGVFTPSWTTKDVCGFLGVSVRWVHEKTRKRLIPHYRFGTLVRFDPQEIAAWATKFHSPETVMSGEHRGGA